MFDSIDYRKGVLSKYIDFDVNDNISLELQIDLLKEDIVQICYESNYILDIGWYPEFNENGFFKIVVIKDYNWENPIIKKKCRTFDMLKKYTEECICVIQSYL